MMRVLLLACALCACSSEPDLDEPCGPEGKTAAQVLDYIQTIYDTPLTYYSDGHSTDMMITARYTGGATACHEPVPGVREYSIVEVDVDVQILTVDGAFDELFSATARTTAFDWAELAYSIPAEQIRGTFDVGMTDHTERAATFAAQFQENDIWGTVSRDARQPNGVPVVIPAAQWRVGDPRD